MSKTEVKRDKATLDLYLLSIVKDFGVEVTLDEAPYATKYIEENYDPFYRIYSEGADETPEQLHDLVLAVIANDILDRKHMKDANVTDLGNGLAIQRSDDEQEITEVDQVSVKKALQVLMNQENNALSKATERLYTKWEEYNERYFFGELSYPLITIEKMNNRTLGNYTAGTDEMGIANHIRFNVNFIALNNEKRILETLRHEMIHQWQDEILYVNKGRAKSIRHLMIDEEGNEVTMETKQKKRPKDWHNKDFKNFAKVVEIPAKGDSCHGNPAKMPEAKSYNRKFVCGCIASNGYPVTVWSTRGINAICQICNQPFFEVPKGGKVIKVAHSHVELPGQDAVELFYRDRFAHFTRFTSKELKDEFLDGFNNKEPHPMTEKTEGVYQKNHNKYHEGYTHWVAYNTADSAPPVKPEEKKLKAKKNPPKTVTPPVAPEEGPSEEPGRRDEVTSNVVPFEQKKQPAPQTNYSYKKAEDLLALYQKLGSLTKMAEYFGKSVSAISQQCKHLHVNFKEGRIDTE